MVNKHHNGCILTLFPAHFNTSRFSLVVTNWRKPISVTSRSKLLVIPKDIYVCTCNICNNNINI